MGNDMIATVTATLKDVNSTNSKFTWNRLQQQQQQQKSQKKKENQAKRSLIIPLADDRSFCNLYKRLFAKKTKWKKKKQILSHDAWKRESEQRAASQIQIS